MGRKNKSDYSGIEPGLSAANRFIRCDKFDTHWNKIQVERIVKKIISAMKNESPVFRSLYSQWFGGGSSYEGLKVGEPEEFDIDILLKMPEQTKPRLKDDTIPGFVPLQLENFEILAREDPELYRAMGKFVDSDNYLLTTQLKSTFMQSIFDKACSRYFPQGVVTLGTKKFRIERVQKWPRSPAFTLTIKGINLDFWVQIDLVPCIVLTSKHWPSTGFRSNPYLKPGDFFIVPKPPKREHLHLDRYFRLSFQMQERLIIYNRYWMKPTIRVIKRINEKFGHGVSSYAIKTLFMRELLKGNPSLNKDTPDLWKRSFADCLVYMLERYLECLIMEKIPYFWYNKLNLLDNLTREQKQKCKKDINKMLIDIKENPSPQTILKYLQKLDS